MEDVVTALSKRGCSDITSSIRLTQCSVHPLAGGGFCDVYRGYLKDGTTIAIKCLRIFERVGDNNETDRFLKRAAQELYQWSKLKHPNILPLMGLAVFRGHLSMISEWMDNGNLMAYVSRNPDADRIRLCMDVCAGLSYLHESGMVHGDLKAANVMVSRERVAMIADFGNSQLKDLTLKFTSTNNSSFSVRWAAPELLLAEAKPQLTEKTDVYAYGMVVLETLTGKVPFEGLNEHQVMRSVAFQRKTPDRADNDLSNELWGILKYCWTWDESTRPGITTIEQRLNALFPQIALEIRLNHTVSKGLALSNRTLASTSSRYVRLGTALYTGRLTASPPLPSLPPYLVDVILHLYLDSILLYATTIRDFRMRRCEYLRDILTLRLLCHASAAQVDKRMSIWPHWKARGSCSDPGHIGREVKYSPDTRILIADVCSNCLPQATDLSIYPNLESVSLGCHNALTYNFHTNTFNLLPISDVITLPRFLAQLEVLHSHWPMIQIIELVASACPGLTELRIVRCTMFNKPECWWWRRYWQDAEHDYMHDHYYPNVGTFVHEMADALCRLKRLKALHLGVYMTNIQAAMWHRTEHKKYHPAGFTDTFSHVNGLTYHEQRQLQHPLPTIHGPGFDPLSMALARRELWKDPCLMCEWELEGRIEETEQRAAIMLGSKLESLRNVSFPSFLGKYRTQPSHWEVQREVKSGPGKKWGVVAKISPGFRYPPGARLRVRTKRPGTGRFSMSVEFDNVMGDWTIEQ